MAPSTRTLTNRVTKQHSAIRNYAKVTKVQVVKCSKSVSAQKLQALSTIVNEEKPRPAPSQLKRKRSDEDEEGAIGESACKTNRLVHFAQDVYDQHNLIHPQSVHPTSPQSSTWTDNITSPVAKRARRNCSTVSPDAIEDLRQIFKFFLKAFSIHLAHNGPGSPAGLGTLLSTVTRLYKKRNVSKEDIQRMLALFEIPIQSVLPNRTLLLHRQSPFKLVVSGVGAHARHLVEYCSDLAYDEEFLLQDYADAIETVCISGQNKKESFLNAPVEQYPLLPYEKGAQTAIRQEKASAVRDHVLGGAPLRLQKETSNNNAEADFTKLSISDTTSTSEPAQASASTKSRTSSLFDRVKAKQSAASLTSAPTSAEFLRRHAIGRIGDVVEILRMKQTQRSSLSATTSNKVSFSMGQTLMLIKSSLSVPMANEEIRLCISILAKEIPGNWLKIVEVGNFQSVILQGQALSGSDVRAVLQNMA